MLDVLFGCVAALAQLERSAENALVRVVRDVLESAPRTVKLYFQLLGLFLRPDAFLVLQFLHDALWKFAPAHGTTNKRLLLDPMPCPNFETLEVKVVAALDLAEADTHFGSHRLLANRANRIPLQLHSFRSNNRLGLHLLLLLHPLTRQLAHYIQRCDVEIGPRSSRLGHRMLPGDKIAELTIDISSLPDDRVIHADPKYFEENVGGVDAVVISAGRAGALQVRTDRGFIFVIESVLKSETEGTALAYQKKRDAGSHVQQLDDVRRYSRAIWLRSRHNN